MHAHVLWGRVRGNDRLSECKFGVFARPLQFTGILVWELAACCAMLISRHPNPAIPYFSGFRDAVKILSVCERTIGLGVSLVSSELLSW